MIPAVIIYVCGIAQGCLETLEALESLGQLELLVKLATSGLQARLAAVHPQGLPKYSHAQGECSALQGQKQ